METTTFKVDTKVSTEQLSDLLTSAFEGGSNYWYMIQEFIKPTQLVHKEFPEDNRKEAHYATEYCLNPGGALMIDDEQADEPSLKKPVRLDIEACQKGLDVMAKKYPHHFKDLLADNTDAITGDVFLQCCIFGDVIYG